MSLAHALLRHAIVSLVKNMVTFCQSLAIARIDSLVAQTRGANLASVRQFAAAMAVDARIM